MEVGQGPNLGCSAKGGKNSDYYLAADTATATATATARMRNF
jgi:hypothetical protein